MLPPPIVPESAGSEEKRRRRFFLGFLGVTKGETLKKRVQIWAKNPGKFYDVRTPPPPPPPLPLKANQGVGVFDPFYKYVYSWF